MSNDSRVHGGTDRLPCTAPLLFDFSTNRNAAGPAPQAVAAIAGADCSTYPDPSYCAVRAQLAAAHRVAPERILIAASASEAIFRLTLAAHLHGARIARVPAHAFADYAHAATTLGLQVQPRRKEAVFALGDQGHFDDACALDWACEPSSPLGISEDIWPHWESNTHARIWKILDCAYAPLRLDNPNIHLNFEQKNKNLDFQKMLSPAAQNHADKIWQIWSPNKALGLTGVRAGYIIAPETLAPAVRVQLANLAPSWVVGAHGVAMLQVWCDPSMQIWLHDSRVKLKKWQDFGRKICIDLGWSIYPNFQANYFCVNIFGKDDLQSLNQNPKKEKEVENFLNYLRTHHGIRLRDAQSFGLSAGWFRLGTLPEQAWLQLKTAALEYRCRFG